MATTKLDITPTLALLLAESRTNWHVSGAISELVDNALGPGRGNADNVFVVLDKKRGLLHVIDDGVGMDNVARAFRLGDTIGRAPGDIGIYGAGGTKALLWLGERVQVETLHQGVVSKVDVTWSQLKDFSIEGEEHPSTTANTKPWLSNEGHGTWFTIHLNASRAVNPSHIIRDLSKTYAPAIRQGRSVRWVNSYRGQFDSSKAKSIALSDPFDNVTFKDKVDINFEITDQSGNKLGVTGTIGIDSQTRSIQDSKVAVGYGPRVILTTRDCYAGVMPGGDKRSFSGRGVTGWLQLSDGWQTYMSLTKDAFDDKPLYEELTQKVFEAIRPMLEKVQDEQFSILIDGLALQLQTAINVRSDRHVEVTRKPRSPVRTVTQETTDEDGEDVNPEHDPEKHQRHKQERKKKTNPLQPEQDGGVPSTGAAQSTALQIQQVEDAVISGCLCNVMPDKESLLIMVNKDHEAVQKAMAATPVNREFLYFLVVREISAVLSDKENIHIAHNLFNDATKKALDEFEEPRLRAQYMARLLYDRVHIAEVRA